MQNAIIIGGGVVTVAVIGAAVWWFMVKRISRAKARKKVVGGNSKLASSLRDEQAKNSIILNSIEDGVVLIDDQNVIRLFNPGASNITGWKREEAEGLDWKSVFKFVNGKGETVTDGDRPFEKARRSAQPLRDNNANLVTKSGNNIAASVSVSPIIDGQQVTGLVGVFRDVSEERQEENQRAEFISTASHEMRTPVAAIEGYLSLALNDKVASIDDRAKEYLEKAHAATKHLGELFQDLLTSAKAEDGRMTNHPEVVELGAFMEQLTSDLRFAADKKQLALEFIIGSSNVIDATATSGDKVVRPLYYAFADPDRLREVITNLFDNACKYTDRGKVTLGLTGNETVVQMYVRDTGHGIPAEDISHLFQKFYRVDNSATRTIGGTGLGLFISRKIIELYHGRIWVESVLGEGSTFYINLPRLTTQQAQGMIAEQSKENPNVITPDTLAASAGH
ncbi:MAG TPA: PAS domain-containing sensor histidine kinase [Verrucomicrobiae bacterium]|nr:PAS domain-containing sensor histidine kinase [Verrucomicrobiae bacterium]